MPYLFSLQRTYQKDSVTTLANSLYPQNLLIIMLWSVCNCQEPNKIPQHSSLLFSFLRRMTFSNLVIYISMLSNLVHNRWFLPVLTSVLMTQRALIRHSHTIYINKYTQEIYKAPHSSQNPFTLSCHSKLKTTRLLVCADYDGFFFPF